MAEEETTRTGTEMDGHEQHELGEAEREKQLEKVQKAFLSFEANGL